MKNKPLGSIDDLEFVDKEEELPVKVLLYGRASTGKTTLASTFPKPMYLLDIKENGYRAIKRKKGLETIKIKTLDELYTIYWHLKDNDDGIKTVVIDTVSALQDLALQDLREKDKSKAKIDPDKMGQYGTMTKRDWGEISSTLKRVIMDFRDLDMNVVFIAHERVFNVEEEDETDRIEPSVGPRLMPSVASTLTAAVDIIGNTYIREKVTEGKPSKMQYCLRVGPHSYYITKIRTPRGTEGKDTLVDASYEDLIDLLQGEE